MKLSAKTASKLALLVFLGAVIGGLAWEIVERIAVRLGWELNLSVGPVGFDLSVIAFHVKANPGMILGLLGGAILFRML